MLGRAARLGALLSGRRWLDALRLFSSLERPDLIEHNALLQSCSLASAWQPSLALLQSLSLARLQPDLRSYTAPLRSLDWSRALQLLQRLEEHLRSDARLGGESETYFASLEPEKG